MKKNNLGFAPIIILILLVLVAGGAYYFGTKNKKSLPSDGKIVPVASVQPSSSSLVKPTSDPTANWKTYTDAVYEFSFKYPGDWKLNCLIKIPSEWLDRNICDLTSPNARLDSGEISNGSYIAIVVSKMNPNYSSFSAYLNYSAANFGYIYKDRQINNINGKIGIIGNKETNFLFERNGQFININWITDSSPESIDQILSTFKFIK